MKKEKVSKLLIPNPEDILGLPIIKETEMELKEWAKKLKIKVDEDNWLWFDEHKTNWQLKDGDTEIPTCWTIRADHGNNWWMLVTTLDISECGYWVCGSINIERVPGSQNDRSLPSAIYGSMLDVGYIVENFFPLHQMKPGMQWGIFVEEPFASTTNEEGHRPMIRIFE